MFMHTYTHTDPCVMICLVVGGVLTLIAAMLWIPIAVFIALAEVLEGEQLATLCSYAVRR